MEKYYKLSEKCEIITWIYKILANIKLKQQSNRILRQIIFNLSTPIILFDEKKLKNQKPIQIIFIKDKI